MHWRASLVWTSIGNCQRESDHLKSSKLLTFVEKEAETKLFAASTKILQWCSVEGDCDVLPEQTYKL